MSCEWMYKDFVLLLDQPPPKKKNHLKIPEMALKVVVILASFSTGIGTVS